MGSRGEQLIETVPEESQTLDLLGKDFKSAIWFKSVQRTKGKYENNVSPSTELSNREYQKEKEMYISLKIQMSKKKTTATKNVLCSLNYVPRAVIINMSFPSEGFTISMAIMALRFDFLLKKKNYAEIRIEKWSMKIFQYFTIAFVLFEECLLFKRLSLTLCWSLYSLEKKHVQTDLPLIHTLKTEKLQNCKSVTNQ